MKYIDAEKLAKAIEDKGLDCSFVLKKERLDTLALIDKLRESEDKRITRAINNMLPFIPDEAYTNNGVTKEGVLNWLEKQKEKTENATKTLTKILKDSAEGFRRILKKKGIDYEVSAEFWENEAVVYSKEEDVKFHKWMDDLMGSIPVEETYEYKKGLEVGMKQKEQNLNPSKSVGLKEQKSAEWSEEDEEMLNSCISSIEESKENRYAYKENDGDTSYDREIAWLKSLRPQPQGTYKQVIHTIFGMLKDKDFYEIQPSYRVSLLNDIRVKCKDAIDCAPILDEPS